MDEGRWEAWWRTWRGRVLFGARLVFIQRPFEAEGRLGGAMGANGLSDPAGRPIGFVGLMG